MTSKSQTMHPVDDRFAPSDIARIVSETFIDRVDYHEEIESTNSRATQLAAAASANTVPDDRSCVLVLTENQTAGRGRGANRWWSTRGALTFSVLIRPNAVDLPTDRWPQLSLTAGLAVCEAIESLLSDVTVGIKWPNDVYLSGRKVCGILVEAGGGQPGSGVIGNIVFGIGVNVHNSAENAPHELRDKVIALSDVATGTIRRVDVLVATPGRLLDHFTCVGEETDSLGRKLILVPTDEKDANVTRIAVVLDPQLRLLRRRPARITVTMTATRRRSVHPGLVM